MKWSHTIFVLLCLAYFVKHYVFFFKVYFIDYTITVVSFLFSPFSPSVLHHTRNRIPCSLSSCPWVIYISSLASTFPILFLTSPCLFSTYHLCFLFPVTFPSFSPLRLPIDNPPCDLHFCDSLPVLVVCLVCFCFCFRWGC